MPPEIFLSMGLYHFQQSEALFAQLHRIFSSPYIQAVQMSYVKYVKGQIFSPYSFLKEKRGLTRLPPY
jgi:hypothetical protein